MRVGILALAWNESILLSHFLKHYLPHAQGIHIFDNGTTDGSIDKELSYLNDDDREKMHIHDVSHLFDIEDLHKLQNAEWKQVADDYDIIIHVDVDEFVVSDKPQQSLRECLDDFWNDNTSTFVQVLGYECPLKLSCQIERADDLVSMATKGAASRCNGLNWNKPCILKPKHFAAWNLNRGRHTWDPVGSNISRWDRRPIMKHIRGANRTLILERRMELNEKLPSYKYDLDSLNRNLLLCENNMEEFAYHGVPALADHLGFLLHTDRYSEEFRDFVTCNLSATAKILEIGARFGVVSCAMNSIIENKEHHIAVEPDSEVWDALERNRKISNSQFQIIRGSLSKSEVMLCPGGNTFKRGSLRMFRQHGSPDISTGIPFFSYEDIKTNAGFTPDTLVMDCEGAFVEMFRDFPELIEDVSSIFVEWDARNPAMNLYWRDVLLSKDFEERKRQGQFGWYTKAKRHHHCVDHLGQLIPLRYEHQEQEDIRAYLRPDAKVLEIGGRFGVVSCAINAILQDKTQHVVVEPDATVWEALDKNRETAEAWFRIFQGAISSEEVTLCNGHAARGRLGAGSMFRNSSSVDGRSCGGIQTSRSCGGIQTLTYQQLKNKFRIPFDTLVVDCEGAFVEMFRDFPEMLHDASTIFIEWDAQNPEHNLFYRNHLVNVLGFKEIKAGFHSVYEKKN